MTYVRIEISCRCCEEFGPHHGRRLIRSCYQRHLAAGTLDQFPILGEQQPTRWRIEDFAEHRTRKLKVHEAAERVGVSSRTGWRYEARLKARVNA